MTDRPVSVLTEAPPPYSEYDESSPSVPEPNAETQAMLRGGYLAHNNQRTPQQSLQDEGPAAVYIRNRTYTGRHDDLITIARAIHPTVTVAGIPFPNEYPAVSTRDVKPEDWKFFATCIVDELEVQAPKGSVSTPLSLNEFRERQDLIDAVVEQWNNTFFAPRGIHVVPAYSFGRRMPSPTPTYRTSQTGVSEAAEIETVTFDTSPRSTRAPTPDTIREFELEHGDNGGRSTPKLERASFVPTITGPADEATRQQATFEKEFQEQLQIDEQMRLQRLAAAGLPSQSAKVQGEEQTKAQGKARRMSHSSSSSSISLSSFDTLSSSDDIALGDVPAIRRTLAEEFRRDPNNMSHLKSALSRIREEVKLQQASVAGASNKLQRKSMQTASKEHRKAMRAEMKELRREMKSYHKIVKIHKKDQRNERRQQRKQSRSDWKAARKEHRDGRKSERRSRKRGNKGSSSQLNLIPERGAESAGNYDWRDAVPGPSSAWPFGKKGSGLPAEEIPPEMEKGWPYGGEMAGWPWDKKIGEQKAPYPPNWPLNGRQPAGHVSISGPQPPGSSYGHHVPSDPQEDKPWPLSKSQSAPVTRKPVPPRRPDISPSPTPPADAGGAGASNAPSPASPHAAHGTHLSPSASFPAASAARAASRSPSPGPAAPADFAFAGQRFTPWGGRGRGFQPGADFTVGRGRRFGDRSGMEEHFGFGRGRGRDRSHSDDGRGRGRGFGRGRSGSEDGTLIGMARNFQGFVMTQAQDGFLRPVYDGLARVRPGTDSLGGLRPAAGMGSAPGARAGSSPVHTQPVTERDGQETGVAHR